VTRDVLSGKAAAGILPACVLEALDRQKKISLSDFRIINPRRETELQCSHSTDVFPSLTVASLQKTDGNTQKTMATALYLMPHTGKEAQWALPASMQSVLDVFYRLKIGPYQYLAQWSIQRFVKENAAEVAVALIFILMVVSYAAVLQMMVRRKTLALRKSMQERQRYEQEIAASREHIAAIERTGIIGQMSSMIAHELKQPLGAINNFGNGLLRRLHRGPVDPKVLEGALEEIVGQGTRASEIVDRVRGYAKHPDPVMQVLDMKPVLEKAAKEFHHIYPDAPPITLACLPYSWAEVDAWEIQLAVLNLLKNASEALHGCPDPQIHISLKDVDGMWHLSVADNGLELTQEKADLFFEPLHTGKMSGMGLGLSIVANIAERHKGHAMAAPNTAIGHGCVMTIVLPKAKAPISLGKS
jgi:two-component system sensor histidine kinase TtrS